MCLAEWGSGHKAAIPSPTSGRERVPKRKQIPTIWTRCGALAQSGVGLDVMASHVKKEKGFWMIAPIRHGDAGRGKLQSLPRRRCLPGQSTSGCTTRMCRVNASLRLKVFSSVQRWHRTFCLRALWIVSSCRVRSYGREKTELHGLPVDGLMRSHLWGPACELRSEVSRVIR